MSFLQFTVNTDIARCHRCLTLFLQIKVRASPSLQMINELQRTVFHSVGAGLTLIRTEAPT